MSTLYYTISDFENIFNAGIDYILPENVKNTFSYLMKELKITEYSPPNYNKTTHDATHSRHHASSHGENTKYNDRRKSKQNGKEISNEDWEALTSFKSTKISVSEGIDKRINEIRVLLNKMSNKNYDTQKEHVLESINEFMKLDPYPEKEQDFTKIANTIYDIISVNKFLSELYADLYNTLYNHYDIFKTVLYNKIHNYYESIDKINYADPNKDYDKYCEYVKINDNRKSNAIFFLNLHKKGTISLDKIFNILEFLLKKSILYIDMENKGNELEEITENVFIFAKIGQTSENNPVWENTIYPMIIDISKMKVKEHISLSNRVVFKYMDIIDLIDE